MHVLVTGADGFIGSHILRGLLRAGHRVTGAVRDPGRFRQRFPGVACMEVDYLRDTEPAVWLPRLEGVNAVINAVGIIRECGSQTFERLHVQTPVALFDACAAVGGVRVVQISALGADELATEPFLLSKKAADDYLSRLDLDWVILQPSVILGSGGRSSALFNALAVLPVIPLPGNGDQKLQPLSVLDLSEAVVRLVETGRPTRLRIPAVGPAAMSLRQLLKFLRARWIKGKARFVRVPTSLLRLGARAGRLLPGVLLDPDTLSMLERGSTADPEGLVRATGLRPRTLSDAWAEQSVGERDVMIVYLHFLRGPLRWSIGLLWIYTGVVSAGLYPLDAGIALLERVGVGPGPAPWLLYLACALDLVLGLATIMNYRLAVVGAIQISTIMAYSLVISLFLPEFWLHPFGPLSKNIPLVVATAVMMAMEDRR